MDNQKQQLESYIDTQLQQGKSLVAISDALIKAGWPLELVHASTIRRQQATTQVNNNLYEAENYHAAHLAKQELGVNTAAVLQQAQTSSDSIHSAASDSMRLIMSEDEYKANPFMLLSFVIKHIGTNILHYGIFMFLQLVTYITVTFVSLKIVIWIIETLLHQPTYRSMLDTLKFINNVFILAGIVFVYVLILSVLVGVSRAFSTNLILRKLKNTPSTSKELLLPSLKDLERSIMGHTILGLKIATVCVITIILIVKGGGLGAIVGVFGFLISVLIIALRNIFVGFTFVDQPTLSAVAATKRAFELLSKPLDKSVEVYGLVFLLAIPTQILSGLASLSNLGWIGFLQIPMFLVIDVVVGYRYLKCKSNLQDNLQLPKNRFRTLNVICVVFSIVAVVIISNILKQKKVTSTPVRYQSTQKYRSNYQLTN